MTIKRVAKQLPIALFLSSSVVAIVIASSWFFEHFFIKRPLSEDEADQFTAIILTLLIAALTAVPAIRTFRSEARRARAREEEQHRREREARARVLKAENKLVAQWALPLKSEDPIRTEWEFARAAGRDFPPEEEKIKSGSESRDSKARSESRDSAEAVAETVPADLLSLSALWEITHSRLDLYHELATGQADRSFRNAQRAMTAGFVLIVCFAVLGAFFSRSTAGSIVAGTLGVVTAGFAGYISRTFVRSQEASAVHLREYFGQPLEFSRYLAAERMLNTVEGIESAQRAEIAGKLLLGLFSIQLPDQTPSDTNTAPPNGNPQSNGSATASKPGEG